MDRSVVSELAAEWRSIADLLAGLDDKEWDVPTDCPGWTVRDQVSHLIGVESMLLGRPAPPDVDPASAPHANGPMGLVNEAWVAARRGKSPAEMRAEFAEVTGSRLNALEAMADEELAKPTKSPIGEVPYAEFMRVRVMDCWVHEHDIRRAVGQPGALDGPPAETSLGRLTGALGFIVGKKAGAPEGASVVVDLEGPMARTTAVRVVDGRAKPIEPPAQATVRLTMTAETFACLATGRWSGEDALTSGGVKVAGDDELARRILQGMAVIT